MIADLSDWSDFKCSQLFDQISTNTKKVKTKECKEVGKYPVVDQGASALAGYVDDETKLIELESPVCIFGDHTRAIKWIDFDFVPGADGTKVLQPKEFLNPRFFYFLLKSVYIEDKGYARHFKLLKDADVKVPSLDEQKCIADKLDSVLAKVEAAQARLDKIPTILKRFRQSVLAAATSGELTKDWRDENSDSVNTLAEFFIAEYDGKELGELPQGWGYVSFKDAADIKSNLTDPKVTPDAIHLAPNHIEANTGKILELVTVEQDGVKSNKHQFYSGQIIYSKIRPYLNKVCAVDFEGLCSADMYPIEAKVNREYLLNVMLSDEFVNYTSQQQGRVVLPKINQKALNKIPVPVPPEAEQLEISRLTSELLEKAEVVEKQYKAGKARLDRLTQSILAKAFRGELLK